MTDNGEKIWTQIGADGKKTDFLPDNSLIPGSKSPETGSLMTGLSATSVSDFAGIMVSAPGIRNSPPLAAICGGPRSNPRPKKPLMIAPAEKVARLSLMPNVVVEC